MFSKIRLDIDAAGPRYRQTNQFLYLGGVIHECADFSFEIERWIRLIWTCFKRFGPECMMGRPLHLV